MLIWPALLLAPLVALTSVALNYALVLPSCASQTRWMLHASTIVCLVVTLAATAAAISALRFAPTARSEDAGTERTRNHFLAQVAVLVGALSTLVILAQWLPVFVLWPCGEI